MKRFVFVSVFCLFVLLPVIAFAQQPGLYTEDNWSESNIETAYSAESERTYIVSEKINAFTSTINSLTSPDMAFTVIFVFVIMLAVTIYLGSGFMAVYWVVMNE